MTLTGDRRRQLLGAGLASLWLVPSSSSTRPQPRHSCPQCCIGVAPLIASAALPPAATAGFGVVAVALTTASIQWNGTWGTAQTWVRIGDVALVAAAGVVLAAVRTRREQQLARVSRIAEVAQRAVLPLVPTHVGPVAAGARYLSAAEDALVGGDLYDWFHSHRRICFIVGDVRGKGINAVEQAARSHPRVPPVRGRRSRPRDGRRGDEHLHRSRSSTTKSSSPLPWSRSTAATRSRWSAAGTLNPCSSPPTATRNCWTSHPAFRSAWDASTSPPPCPGRQVIDCCCTPTG